MLTDSKLKALRPTKARYIVSDRDGLYLEVHPGGKMTWRYRYTLRGRREKVTLGHYPAITLAEARRRRLHAEQQVAKGISPARERQREKGTGSIETVTDLAQRWIRDVLHPAAKASARQSETYLRRDVLPRIGAIAPTDVTTLDIRGCVDAVLKRGHGQAARRVRDTVKRLFQFAEGLGITRGNPVTVIRPEHIAPAIARSRVLMGAEIKAFLDAVYASRLSRPMKLALHFLLLVPARKGELFAARRAHFDLESAIWDIPAGNSKNGAAIRHKLPRQATEIVQELMDLTNSDWLLPSTRSYGQKPVSRTGINQAFRAIPNLPKDLVIHDLRRSVRTGLGELGGVPEQVAELCLNHRPRGVAGVYDRSERLEERATALQRWADYVDAVRTGHRNVVQFRHRAA